MLRLGIGKGIERADHQVPMMPPSRRRMAIVAERGRPPASPSGHELIAFGRFGSLRPGMRQRRLAGVLDVHEHRAQVGRQLHRRDLAADRPGQEAAHLAGGRIGGQHLVVADPSPVAAGHVLRRRIGLDPQHAASVDVTAVGLGERHAALDVAALDRVACASARRPAGTRPSRSGWRRRRRRLRASARCGPSGWARADWRRRRPAAPSGAAACLCRGTCCCSA